MGLHLQMKPWTTPWRQSQAMWVHPEPVWPTSSWRRDGDTQHGPRDTRTTRGAGRNPQTAERDRKSKQASRRARRRSQEAPPRNRPNNSTRSQKPLGDPRSWWRGHSTAGRRRTKKTPVETDEGGKKLLRFTEKDPYLEVAQLSAGGENMQLEACPAGAEGRMEPGRTFQVFWGGLSRPRARAEAGGLPQRPQPARAGVGSRPGCCSTADRHQREEESTRSWKSNLDPLSGKLWA